MRISRIAMIVGAVALLAVINFAQQQQPPQQTQKPPQMAPDGGAWGQPGMMGQPGMGPQQPGMPGMPGMGQGQAGQPGMMGQPGMAPQQPGMPGMMGQGPRQMQLMMEVQQMDERMRDKLNAMNIEIGDRKIEAMAATINELAEQNRHMRQMILELSRQAQPMPGWPQQPGMGPGMPGMAPGMGQGMNPGLEPGWGVPPPPPSMMGMTTTVTLSR